MKGHKDDQGTGTSVHDVREAESWDSSAWGRVMGDLILVYKYPTERFKEAGNSSF